MFLQCKSGNFRKRRALIVPGSHKQVVKTFVLYGFYLYLAIYVSSQRLCDLWFLSKVCGFICKIFYLVFKITVTLFQDTKHVSSD